MRGKITRIHIGTIANPRIQRFRSQTRCPGRVSISCYMQHPSKRFHQNLSNQMTNHTSWVAVVTSTDRPKSVRNRCVIELFCGVVCVVTLPFWHFCWCWGFCHRTESDLFLFLYTSMYIFMYVFGEDEVAFGIYEIATQSQFRISMIILERRVSYAWWDYRCNWRTCSMTSLGVA